MNYFISQIERYYISQISRIKASYKQSMLYMSVFFLVPNEIKLKKHWVKWPWSQSCVRLIHEACMLICVHSAAKASQSFTADSSLSLTYITFCQVFKVNCNTFFYVFTEHTEHFELIDLYISFIRLPCYLSSAKTFPVEKSRRRRTDEAGRNEEKRPFQTYKLCMICIETPVAVQLRGFAYTLWLWC